MKKLEKEEATASMSPVEIVGFDRLPEDFIHRWNCGEGPFWMVTQIETEKFLRSVGVCVPTYEQVSIDICPPDHYAYVHGPAATKIASARHFIEAYGGKAYWHGEEVEL